MESPREAFATIPQAFAVVGGLSVGVGVAYTLGYFWIVGPKFLALLEIDDFFRMSLQGLPFAVLFFFVSYEVIAEVLFVRSKPGAAAAAPLPPAERRRKFIRSAAAFGLLWMFVFIALFSRDTLPLFLFVTGFLFAIAIYLLNPPEERRSTRDEFLIPRACLFVLMMASYVSAAGAMAALSDLRQIPGEYCFVFAGSPTPKNGVLLFRSETGYLLSLDDNIVDRRRVVVFYPEAQISRVCRFVHDSQTPIESIWNGIQGK